MFKETDDLTQNLIHVAFVAKLWAGRREGKALTKSMTEELVKLASAALERAERQGFELR